MENKLTTIPPEVGGALGNSILDKATATANYMEGLVVSTEDDVDKAQRALNESRKIYKGWDEKRKEITRVLDVRKRAIMDFFNPPMKLVEKAGNKLKKKLYEFSERKRAEAARAAEEERKRIERNAAKRAERAEEKGEAERAEDIRQEAAQAAAQAAQAVTEARGKTTQVGVSQRDNWKAEVLDMRLFAEQVANGLVPAHLLILDSKEASKYATAMKDTVSIQGLRIYNEPYLAANRGR